MNKATEEPSREKIWKMFDEISPTYDRVNRVMTFGLDQLWRRRVADFLPQGDALSLLDCATGTGDQIMALMKKSDRIARTIGVDLAEEMLAIAKRKTDRTPYANLVTYQVASALELPFEQARFDCVTITFGIRNVTSVADALKEFYRVLKPGGRLLIVEGSVPRFAPLKWMHLFYLRHMLPRIGGVISKNRAAYRYLNRTIETFPQGEAFCALLHAVGFIHVKAHPLTGGIVTLYQADKDAAH